METKINKGEQIRLYGFIGIVLAVLGVVFWIFNNDTPAATAPQSAVVSNPDVGETSTVMLEKPSFDVVRISRGGTGVIAGRATPGAVVEIKVGDTLLDSVIADQNGEWVAIIENPLAPGSAELTLTARNPRAGEVLDAASVVVVSVPARDEDRFVEREENGVVAVLTPKDGNGPSRILQRPGSGFRNVGENLRVDLIDYGAGVEALISGHANPRADVRIYMDDDFVGSIRVSDEGNWQFPFDSVVLSPGDHVVRVDQTIGDGDVRLRVEQPFVMGASIDPSLAATGVIVKPGNTLWHIARQLYGSGVRYTMIFKENSSRIQDPDLIYPGQVFALPKTTD